MTTLSTKASFFAVSTKLFTTFFASSCVISCFGSVEVSVVSTVSATEASLFESSLSLLIRPIVSPSFPIGCETVK